MSIGIERRLISTSVKVEIFIIRNETLKKIGKILLIFLNFFCGKFHPLEILLPTAHQFEGCLFD